MRFIALALALLPAVLAAPLHQVRQATCSSTYTVVSGDYCDLISQKTGVSVATILSLNPSVNAECTNLQIGQVLCLGGTSGTSSPSATQPPPASTSTPAGGCSNTYTVVSGDYCELIAQNTGVSVATILALNPSVNAECTNLQIGQVLCLGTGGTSSPSATQPPPASTSTPAGGCSSTYTVVSGDYCELISQNTGVSVATILALNPSVNAECTNLQVGQVLCLGGSSGTSSPTATQSNVVTQPPPTNTARRF